MNKQKQAFTLVELIVVITILAILATIAFISFQWFARDARDSTRLSDVKVMQKALQVYEVKESRYPEPTNPTWITYSWLEIWTQWTFWRETRAELWTIWQNIVDPLTKSEYTYSLLNTKRKYQIWAILEWWTLVSNNITNNANAAWTETAYAYVTWDYNWLLAKSTTCMLAVPSIIASDTSDTDLATIIANKKLIYKWYRNLPSSYSWTTLNLDWEANLVLTNQIEAYCWDLSQLTSSWAVRLTMLNNLQTAYTWTSIQNDAEQVVQLLAASTDEEKAALAAAYVNDIFGTSLSVSSTSDWWSGGGSIPTTPLSLEWDAHGLNDNLYWVKADWNWNMFVSWYSFSWSIWYAYVRKIDSSWNEIWTKEWDAGWVWKYNYLRSIKLDSLWNIYVAWFTMEASRSYQDFYVRKMDSNWNEIWSQKWTWYGDDKIMSMQLDTSWNVYLAWSTFNWNVTVFLYLRKIDSDWNIAWTKVRNWPSGTFDVLNWVQVDSLGNVYVAWYIKAWNINFYVSKIDSSWNEIWNKTWDWYGSTDYFNGIQIDSLWNTYAAWVVQNWSYTDFYIRKMDSSWNEVWSQEWDWHSNNDYLYWVQLDSSWNIYVNWYTTNWSYTDFYIRKMDSSWNEVWSQEWDWHSNNDYIFWIDMDISWNIYVVWNTKNWSYTDFYLRKMDSDWN